MLRSIILALLLTLAQDPKPGWQARLETASKTAATWKTRRDDVRRQILVAAASSGRASPNASMVSEPL